MTGNPAVTSTNRRLSTPTDREMAPRRGCCLRQGITLQERSVWKRLRKVADPPSGPDADVTDRPHPPSLRAHRPGRDPRLATQLLGAIGSHSAQASRRPGRAGREDAYYLAFAVAYVQRLAQGSRRPIQDLAEAHRRPSGLRFRRPRWRPLPQFGTSSTRRGCADCLPNRRLVVRWGADPKAKDMLKSVRNHSRRRAS